MKNKLLFFIFPLALILTACGEPEPLTQEKVDAINCQPGDLPEGQTYNAVESRFPASTDIFLEGSPTLISNRTWNDIASTRQTFSCTIYVFAEVSIAQENMQTACGELKPPLQFPRNGDLSCRNGDQEVNLIFQKDEFIVWIWADYQGQGIERVANRLEDRIRNP
ncbi:MAG: hypothetical protein Fur0022_43140 [Anaerolineales bacterium]